jgi:DNA-directed RNA polymerase
MVQQYTEDLLAIFRKDWEVQGTPIKAQKVTKQTFEYYRELEADRQCEAAKAEGMKPRALKALKKQLLESLEIPEISEYELWEKAWELSTVPLMPEIPAYGSFDINEILKATYTFS